MCSLNRTKQTKTAYNTFYLVPFVVVFGLLVATVEEDVVVAAVSVRCFFAGAPTGKTSKSVDDSDGALPSVTTSGNAFINDSKATHASNKHNISIKQAVQ